MKTQMTDQQIEELKNRYASGEDIIILARDFKIRNSRITEICGKREKKRKTHTPPEMKEEILKRAANGLSPHEISKAMGIPLGKAEYYAYGYDKNRPGKVKANKKKSPYKPIVEIKTYLDGNWRYFVDDRKKAGPIETTTYSKEELSQKFGNVLAEAEQKHNQLGKRPITTNYEAHFKARGA